MTVETPALAAGPARALVCRGCGAEHPLAAQHACWHCFGPLEIAYDPDALRAVTRERIAAGPANLWRYAPLLPVGLDPAGRVSLDPGFTPLVAAPALASELGLRTALLSMAGSLAFALGARWIWKRAIVRYTSASS